MIQGFRTCSHGLSWAGLMGLLLVLAYPAGFVAAQVSTPSADEGRMYVDPTNRYGVPIPTNWTAEEREGYVVIVTDDGKISITASLVEATGATSAIGIVMRMIDPEFDSAALDDLLATPASATDENALYTFDDGAESGQLTQALGRKAGDDAFVLVLQGELEAVKLRQIQVDKIFEGIWIRVESDASPIATPAA